MSKCTYVKGGYADNLCDVMNRVVEIHPTKRSKGIYASSRVNIKTFESVGSLIILKQGDFIENGIALNVCPFCGGKLRDDSKE